MCGEAKIPQGLARHASLSPAEAEAFEEKSRQCGWRALWYPGKLPEWRSLSGHPVAVYRNHVTTGADHAVLLWKHAGSIHEMGIAGDVLLDPAITRTQESFSGRTQLALF